MFETMRYQAFSHAAFEVDWTFLKVRFTFLIHLKGILVWGSCDNVGLMKTYTLVPWWLQHKLYIFRKVSKIIFLEDQIFVKENQGCFEMVWNFSFF